MFEEANWGDLLYTQITSSPRCPYLPTFLPFILPFIQAIFLFALPAFTSDKLLCKFVEECTQAKDLDEVSLFYLLNGTPLSFFSSFGYEWGKKARHGRVIKSLSDRDIEKEGKKGRKSWDNIWQWFTTVHTTGERYGLSDPVKGKAGVTVCQNCVSVCVSVHVWCI